MATLFCFGLGYCAEHYVAECGGRFARIAGTVTTAEKAAVISASFGDRAVEALVFDGTAVSPALAAAVRDADAMLVSVPPGATDPVLARCAEIIAAAPRRASIVYLSTVGVYGDHAGVWVDETTPPAPVSRRSRERLAAEDAWRALGASCGKAVAVLRLSGIYGPGQNSLLQVARGTARRMDKPGQVFNRIHVADIAQAIDAAFAHHANGVFNITDDAPTPPGEPVVFAAQLLDVEPPPLVPFAEAAATMSPMALSFYAESKRVRNDKMKRELGVRLRYPSYREGLRALRVTESAN